MVLRMIFFAYHWHDLGSQYLDGYCYDPIESVCSEAARLRDEVSFKGA